MSLRKPFAYQDADGEHEQRDKDEEAEDDGDFSVIESDAGWLI